MDRFYLEALPKCEVCGVFATVRLMEVGKIEHGHYCAAHGRIEKNKRNDERADRAKNEHTLAGDIFTVAKAQTLCKAGAHERINVSITCGHRDVCVRCRDHKHGEDCHTLKGSTRS